MDGNGERGGGGYREGEIVGWIKRVRQMVLSEIFLSMEILVWFGLVWLGLGVGVGGLG